VYENRLGPLLGGERGSVYWLDGADAARQTRSISWSTTDSNGERMLGSRSAIVTSSGSLPEETRACRERESN